MHKRHWLFFCGFALLVSLIFFLIHFFSLPKGAMQPSPPHLPSPLSGNINYIGRLIVYS
jgi:hypothetical protein